LKHAKLAAVFADRKNDELTKSIYEVVSLLSPVLNLKAALIPASHIVALHLNFYPRKRHARNISYRTQSLSTNEMND